jgi:1-phosphofructokinase family hexose kinase
MTTLSSAAHRTSSLLVAGPNLTIDRTMRLPELVPGRVLRAAEVVATPGGKGLNVGRAALAMGVSATLVSFVPGHTGKAVAALIAQEGVILRGVPAPGEIRSTVVVTEDGGRVTVLNEPGPAVSAELWRSYEAELAVGLDRAGALVCSGSLPPGAPIDGYARLATLARSRGVVTVVDVAGAALRAALESRADVVVPNLGEAEALLQGASGEDVDAVAQARRRAVAAAVELVRRGARMALVTAAAAGAALAVDGSRRHWWLSAPPVRVDNPIGAGDAFAAGLAAALARGQPATVAAREAVAAGAAGVETALAGHLDSVRMRDLVAQVTLSSA